MKISNKFRLPAGLHPQVIDELAEANKNIVDKHKELMVYDELLKIKQERKDRETRLRPLLLNIGMVISLLFAITAIYWRSSDNGNIIDLGEVQAQADEIIEIPISNQPPPPPPAKEVFTILEVNDTEIIEEIVINLDVEVTAEEAVEEVDFVAPEIEEEVVEEVFVIVEQEPTPKGGVEAFYSYLASELKYPPAALRIGISGSVYVQFVIEKDGSITNVELAKGIGAGCDEEALRVIKNAPAWNPGKQRGMPVRVRKIIPVRFILAKD